jgi:hypothetical protein
MPSNSPLGRMKTANDLSRWMRLELDSKLVRPAELIAHGGTALSLRGIKPSTKDVDFAVPNRDQFEDICIALERAGYNRLLDSQPTPRSRLVRYRNPKQIVDVVDLCWPMWNNWNLSDTILGRALRVPYGKIVLVVPEAEASFMFKTYPLRDTDLGELATMVRHEKLDQGRVISLVLAQDRLIRASLSNPNLPTEPLIDLFNLRCRYAGSVFLLSPRVRRRIPRIFTHSQRLFAELGLPWNLTQVIRKLRDVDEIMDWESAIDESGERIRKELSIRSGSH